MIYTILKRYVRLISLTLFIIIKYKLITYIYAISKER
jgi:hypothetical protein